jgi:hypothetical protein
MGATPRAPPGHAGKEFRGTRVTAQTDPLNAHRRQPSICYTPVSCRGRYQTDRHPGAALQKTAMCPAGPPPARSRAAWAGAQSHSTQLTVIRPGPHSCPFSHCVG